MHKRIMVSLALMSGSALVFSQTGGEFEIRSSTIDAGGGLSEGGQLSVAGTAGQPDAAPDVAVGGRFRLTGGFWAQPDPDGIFKDGFEEEKP